MGLKIPDISHMKSKKTVVREVSPDLRLVTPELRQVSPEFFFKKTRKMQTAVPNRLYQINFRHENWKIASSL